MNSIHLKIDYDEAKGEYTFLKVATQPTVAPDASGAVQNGASVQPTEVPPPPPAQNSMIVDPYTPIQNPMTPPPFNPFNADGVSPIPPTSPAPRAA